MNVIIWSKWSDMYGGSEQTPEYVPESNVTKFDNYPLDDDDNEEMEESEGGHPVVITPIGIIPVKPFNDPTKIFNFWMGETNFDLNEYRVGLLNGVPGVEILDVFTRYRFRIAVGNAFKFQEVRQAIEQNLDAVRPEKVATKELNPTVKAQVKQIIQLHLSSYPYWTVYVLPNGKLDWAASHENNDKYQEEIEVYKEAKRLVGGDLVSSGDNIL